MARRANEQAGGYEDFAARVEEFLVVDAQLVTSDDDQFRFHSGKPAV